jgi:hypothetical protein
MFSRQVIGILTAMLVITAICPVSLRAAPGDCNGDALVNSSDAVILVGYLFNGGSVANRSDCDCDGHPGITLGDVLQILAYSFMGCSVYPSPGTDLSVPSHVKFFFNSQVDFGATPTPRTSIEIHVDMPAGFDIEAFCIPFSFAADAGGQVLDLANIDFTGTVAANISGSVIDNVNKYFAIGGGGNGMVTALPGGTKGKLCTVNFNLVSLPTDNPTCLRMSTTDRITPLLFHQLCYSGVDGARVYLPEAIRAPYGDVNTDQTCNVSDAVWIINYVFIGGPRPGNLEPWQ